jgi:glycosyltransferase involved in cell wall biosynthesis
MDRLKVAVVADYAEEGWASMDLVAEMLATRLTSVHRDVVDARVIRPRFARPLTRFGSLRRSKSAFNAERALNRYLLYPLWLRRQRGKFTLFHIVDHSYSHLTNHLPSDRTIITCHDIDAFRAILTHSHGPRSAVPRAIARRILRGFRRAAMVTCVSRATRDAIVEAGLRSPLTTVVIANGVDSAMSPEPDPVADRKADSILGGRDADAAEIVHVGSTEPRKRIETLLQIFAGIVRKFPNARLLRVGGGLLPEHWRVAGALGIKDRIVTMPFLERKVLASVYRRAAVVLLPSDAEGFALPIVEAMACGRPVVASDLPVLREVGGDEASYCSVADIRCWIETVCALLEGRDDCNQVRARTAWAARFSWDTYSASTVEVYRAVADMAAGKRTTLSIEDLEPTTESGALRTEPIDPALGNG